VTRRSRWFPAALLLLLLGGGLGLRDAWNERASAVTLAQRVPAATDFVLWCRESLRFFM
jgi:hypothetical protein